MHISTLGMPSSNGTKAQNAQQRFMWKLCEAWSSQTTGRRKWFKGRIKQESEQMQTAIWRELKNKYGYAKEWDEEPSIDPIETWQDPIGDNENVANSKEGSSKKKAGRDCRKRFVQWDDDETEFLALEMHRLRREDPGAQVVHLLNAAQEQLATDRRRNIATVGQFEPVLRKLKEIDERVWNDHKHMIQYREKVEEQKTAPTRTEIFASATDEELEEFFKERVLDNSMPAEIVDRLGVKVILEMLPMPTVAAFVVQKQMENFDRLNNLESLMWDVYAQIESQKTNEQPKPISTQAQDRASNVASKKLKVVFYGLLPEQQQEVMSRMGGNKIRFHFIDKNRRDGNVVPPSADIIVFWARYCSHSLQTQIKRDIPNGCKFISHYNGIGEMVKKINKVIKEMRS